MGYTNVGDDVLMDIWHSSQAQLETNVPPKMPQEAELPTANDFSYSFEASQPPTHGPAPAFGPWEQDPEDCDCPSCRPPVLTQPSGAQSPSPRQRRQVTKEKGFTKKQAVSVVLSPLSQGTSKLASVTSSQSGVFLEDHPRAFNRSVIYPMDPYGPIRQQQRLPKSDPVALYHAMDRRWKKDKFLTQANRRQVMWDMRLHLAHQAVL
eukprot:TRINITY_DN11571_c0_g1_i1.p1 TRINITY_DN11571_c0_g1~~TRINITY_DN11571_c0_g1_i1.p1  ORF type:complete len:232 (+),score=7.93 TRINITY_DN11571_c0_g1_i1:78-698(+)